MSSPRRLAVLALCAVLSAPGPHAAAAAMDPIYLLPEQPQSAGMAFNTKVVFHLRPSGWVTEDGFPNFLDGVRRWQLQIVNFFDKKVDFLQGHGRPPTRLEWNGLNDDGELLPDGFYRARFVWMDERRATQSTKDIDISLLSPPGLRELMQAKVRLAYSGDDVMLRIDEAISFDPGQVEIRRSAIPVLEQVANFIARYPNCRVSVFGHADGSGSRKANLALSTQRAEAVYRLLNERGIGALRMAYHGVGALNPIATNETEDGRAKNRRVEIVLHRADS
jgi:outer membrane protein OmpA-like peptidoglycan-associated protein